MTPYPITFYLYADDREEIRDLEAALYDFVKGKADQGRPVTAQKVAKAVRSWGGNPIVNRYFDVKQ